MFALLTPLSLFPFSLSLSTLCTFASNDRLLLPENEKRERTTVRTEQQEQQLHTDPLPLCVQFMYVCMSMSLSLFSRHTYRDCEPMEWHPVTHTTTSSYTLSVRQLFSRHPFLFSNLLDLFCSTYDYTNVQYLPFLACNSNMYAVRLLEPGLLWVNFNLHRKSISLQQHEFKFCPLLRVIFCADASIEQKTMCMTHFSSITLFTPSPPVPGLLMLMAQHPVTRFH